MIYTQKEIYTLNGATQDLPGFDKKYLNIVDYILRITEDIWEKKQIHVINETYTNDVVIHSGAEIIRGIKSVIQGTINTLHSFPDRKMGGEAVIWSEDGDKRFLSSHRIGSSATNLGVTKYGPATDKKIFFRTIADCAVKENKIYEEWLVRDNLAIIKQLGFDPVDLAKMESKYDGKKSLAYTTEFKKNTSRNGIVDTKAENQVRNLLNMIWQERSFSTIEAFYRPDALIYTIENQELNLKGFIDLLKDLLANFPSASFEICRITKNTNAKDQDEIAVRWRFLGKHVDNGFFGEASNTPVLFYGVTHYILKENLIVEEYCIFDAFDILCQIHASKELENNSNGVNQYEAVKPLTNKLLANTMIEALNTALDNGEDIKKILAGFVNVNVATICSDPIGELDGIDGLYEGFWKVLLTSFPDTEIQPYILIGGTYNGNQAVSIAGNIVGTFKEDWLTIPANDQPTYLRFSMQLFYDGGEIVKQWIYIDVLSVINQAGYKLFPTLGVDQVAPIPHAHDGIKLCASDPQVGNNLLT